MWRDCVEGRVVWRRLAERRWRRDATSEIGVQQSVRYEGALPWRQLYAIVASLYFTRSGTSSQWRSTCISWDSPRLNFFVPLRRRAAVGLMLMFYSVCCWLLLILLHVLSVSVCLSCWCLVSISVSFCCNWLLIYVKIVIWAASLMSCYGSPLPRLFTVCGFIVFCLLLGDKYIWCWWCKEVQMYATSVSFSQRTQKMS